MDDLDLYDDLDAFQEQQEKKSKDLQDAEQKYQEAQKTIQSLEEEKQTLQKKIKRMELSFQSLLDTARTEIQRKNNEIDRLRKEKDDLCFRRKFPNRPKETESKSSISQQVVKNPFAPNMAKEQNDTDNASDSASNQKHNERSRHRDRSADKLDSHKRQLSRDGLYHNKRQKSDDAQERNKEKLNRGVRESHYKRHDRFGDDRRRRDDKERHSSSDSKIKHNDNSLKRNDAKHLSTSKSTERKNESPERRYLESKTHRNRDYEQKSYSETQSRERTDSRQPNHKAEPSHSTVNISHNLCTPQLESFEYDINNPVTNGIKLTSDTSNAKNHATEAIENKRLEESNSQDENLKQRQQSNEKFAEEKYVSKHKSKEKSIKKPSNENKKIVTENDMLWEAETKEESSKERRAPIDNDDKADVVSINKCNEVQITKAKAVSNEKSTKNITEKTPSNNSQNIEELLYENLDDDLTKQSINEKHDEQVSVALTHNQTQQASTLCTPNKVALYDALFGPSPSSSSVHSSTKSLLNNIMGILSKSRTDIISSATTSPGDFSDCELGQSVTKETIENTPKIYNKAEFDKCFTKNTDKSALDPKSIELIDKELVLEICTANDDLVHKSLAHNSSIHSTVSIPGLDLLETDTEKTISGLTFESSLQDNLSLKTFESPMQSFEVKEQQLMSNTTQISTTQQSVSNLQSLPTEAQVLEPLLHSTNQDTTVETIPGLDFLNDETITNNDSQTATISDDNNDKEPTCNLDDTYLYSSDITKSVNIQTPKSLLKLFESQNMFLSPQSADMRNESSANSPASIPCLDLTSSPESMSSFKKDVPNTTTLETNKHSTLCEDQASPQLQTEAQVAKNQDNTIKTIPGLDLVYNEAIVNNYSNESKTAKGQSLLSFGDDNKNDEKTTSNLDNINVHSSEISNAAIIQFSKSPVKLSESQNSLLSSQSTESSKNSPAYIPCLDLTSSPESVSSFKKDGPTTYTLETSKSSTVCGHQPDNLETSSIDLSASKLAEKCLPLSGVSLPSFDLTSPEKCTNIELVEAKSMELMPALNKTDSLETSSNDLIALKLAEKVLPLAGVSVSSCANKSSMICADQPVCLETSLNDPNASKLAEKCLPLSGVSLPPFDLTSAETNLNIDLVKPKSMELMSASNTTDIIPNLVKETILENAVLPSDTLEGNTMAEVIEIEYDEGFETKSLEYDQKQLQENSKSFDNTLMLAKELSDCLDTDSKNENAASSDSSGIIPTVSETSKADAKAKSSISCLTYDENYVLTEDEAMQDEYTDLDGNDSLKEDDFIAETQPLSLKTSIEKLCENGNAQNNTLDLDNKKFTTTSKCNNISVEDAVIAEEKSVNETVHVAETNAIISEEPIATSSADVNAEEKSVNKIVSVAGTNAIISEECIEIILDHVHAEDKSANETVSVAQTNAIIWKESIEMTSKDDVVQKKSQELELKEATKIPETDIQANTVIFNVATATTSEAEILPQEQELSENRMASESVNTPLKDANATEIQVPYNEADAVNKTNSDNDLPIDASKENDENKTILETKCLKTTMLVASHTSPDNAKTEKDQAESIYKKLSVKTSEVGLENTNDNQKTVQNSNLQSNIKGNEICLEIEKTRTSLEIVNVKILKTNASNAETNTADAHPVNSKNDLKEVSDNEEIDSENNENSPKVRTKHEKVLQSEKGVGDNEISKVEDISKDSVVEFGSEKEKFHSENSKTKAIQLVHKNISGTENNESLCKDVMMKTKSSENCSDIDEENREEVHVREDNKDIFDDKELQTENNEAGQKPNHKDAENCLLEVFEIDDDGAEELEYKDTKIENSDESQTDRKVHEKVSQSIEKSDKEIISPDSNCKLDGEKSKHYDSDVKQSSEFESVQVVHDNMPGTDNKKSREKTKPSETFEDDQVTARIAVTEIFETFEAQSLETESNKADLSAINITTDGSKCGKHTVKENQTREDNTELEAVVTVDHKVNPTSSKIKAINTCSDIEKMPEFDNFIEEVSESFNDNVRAKQSPEVKLNSLESKKNETTNQTLCSDQFKNDEKEASNGMEGSICQLEMNKILEPISVPLVIDDIGQNVCNSLETDSKDKENTKVAFNKSSLKLSLVNEENSNELAGGSQSEQVINVKATETGIMSNNLFISNNDILKKSALNLEAPPVFHLEITEENPCDKHKSNVVDCQISTKAVTAKQELKILHCEVLQPAFSSHSDQTISNKVKNYEVNNSTALSIIQQKNEVSNKSLTSNENCTGPQKPLHNLKVQKVSLNPPSAIDLIQKRIIINLNADSTNSLKSSTLPDKDLAQKNHLKQHHSNYSTNLQSTNIRDCFTAPPYLPSVSTNSPTPSNFSGIFSKKTLDAAEESIENKRKNSPKPKEYIIPAASVLCTMVNLENATKVNKKLHWEMLDNKNELTEIEDDSDAESTDEENGCKAATEVPTENICSIEENNIKTENTCLNLTSSKYLRSEEKSHTNVKNNTIPTVPITQTVANFKQMENLQSYTESSFAERETKEVSAANATSTESIPAKIIKYRSKQATVSKKLKSKLLAASPIRVRSAESLMDVRLLKAAMIKKRTFSVGLPSKPKGRSNLATSCRKMKKKNAREQQMVSKDNKRINKKAKKMHKRKAANIPGNASSSEIDNNLEVPDSSADILSESLKEKLTIKSQSNETHTKSTSISISTSFIGVKPCDYSPKQNNATAKFPVAPNTTEEHSRRHQLFPSERKPNCVDEADLRQVVDNNSQLNEENNFKSPTTSLILPSYEPTEIFTINEGDHGNTTSSGSEECAAKNDQHKGHSSDEQNSSLAENSEPECNKYLTKQEVTNRSPGQNTIDTKVVQETQVQKDLKSTEQVTVSVEVLNTANAQTNPSFIKNYKIPKLNKATDKAKGIDSQPLKGHLSSFRIPKINRPSLETNKYENKSQIAGEESKISSKETGYNIKEKKKHANNADESSSEIKLTSNEHISTTESHKPPPIEIVNKLYSSTPFVQDKVIKENLQDSTKSADSHLIDSCKDQFIQVTKDSDKTDKSEKQVIACPTSPIDNTSPDIKLAKLKYRRKSLNLHRRILDSSSDEDEIQIPQPQRAKEPKEFTDHKQRNKLKKDSKTHCQSPESVKTKNLTNAIASKKSVQRESNPQNTKLSDNVSNTSTSRNARPKGGESEDKSALFGKFLKARSEFIRLQKELQTSESSDDEVLSSMLPSTKKQLSEKAGCDIVPSGKKRPTNESKSVKSLQKTVQSSDIQHCVESKAPIVKDATNPDKKHIKNRRKSMFAESNLSRDSEECSTEPPIVKDATNPDKKHTKNQRKSMFAESNLSRDSEECSTDTNHLKQQNNADATKSSKLMTKSNSKGQEKVKTVKLTKNRRKSMYVESKISKDVDSCSDATNRLNLDSNKETLLSENAKEVKHLSRDYEEYSTDSIHLKQLNNTEATKSSKLMIKSNSKDEEKVKTVKSMKKRRKSMYIESKISNDVGSCSEDTNRFNLDSNKDALLSENVIEDKHLSNERSKSLHDSNAESTTEIESQSIGNRKPLRNRSKSMYLEKESLQSEDLKKCAEDAINLSDQTNFANETGVHKKLMDPRLRSNKFLEMRRNSTYVEPIALVVPEFENENEETNSNMEQNKTNLVDSIQKQVTSSFKQTNDTKAVTSYRMHKKSSNNCTEGIEESQKCKSTDLIEDLVSSNMSVLKTKQSLSSNEEHTQIIEMKTSVSLSSKNQDIQRNLQTINTSVPSQQMSDKQAEDISDAVSSIQIPNISINKTSGKLLNQSHTLIPPLKPVIQNVIIVPPPVSKQRSPRKRRMVKVVSTSRQDSNITKKFKPNIDDMNNISLSPTLNHPIFHTQVRDEAPNVLNITPLSHDEIDSNMRDMFQSPQHEPELRSINVQDSMISMLPLALHASNPDITIDETISSNREDEQNSLNLSELNASKSLNSTSSHNQSDSKLLSLGSSEYRFEKVSENVVNLFISRKRKRKRMN